MRTIHIIARDINRYDAVGNFCFQVAALASQHGLVTKLHAENSNLHTTAKVSDISEISRVVQDGDLIFYNHSIFDPSVSLVTELQVPKAYYFHNITPPDLLLSYEPKTAENCRLGLEQVALAKKFDVVLANSEASAHVVRNRLAEVGSDTANMDIRVCPPVVDAQRWLSVTSVEDDTTDSGTRRFLMVGRLAPHKGHRQMLECIDRLATTHPNIAIDIVGGPADGALVQEIKKQAATIGARKNLEINFFHDIPEEMLKRLYENAFACLSFSQHEGYCIPALDALFFDKPMFSMPLPALQEVLGPAYLPLSLSDTDANETLLGAALQNPDFLEKGHHDRKKALESQLALADGHVLVAALKRLMEI